MICNSRLVNRLNINIIVVVVVKHAFVDKNLEPARCPLVSDALV